MPIGVLRRSGYAVFTMMELLDWKPDAIVQVGIGNHHEEVELMQKAWSDAKFIGFEPHPGMAKGLQKTYPGELYNLAVSNFNGVGTLHDKPRHSDGASLFEHKDCPGSKGHKVQIVYLDSFFHTKPVPFGRIMLWVDCEGSELDALQGGQDFIRHVDVINIELTSDPPGKGWCDMMTTHRWLVDHGFRRQSSHSQRSSAGQSDCIYVRKSLWNPKYCSCPVSFIEAEKDG